MRAQGFKEQMIFEKEAEEWVKENMDCCKTDNSVNQPIPYFDEEERCCAKSAFQDGAEFGYNKAKEYAKTIIQDLLDNSDEYARQRAMDFLEAKE